MPEVSGDGLLALELAEYIHCVLVPGRMCVLLYQRHVLGQETRSIP